jgi:hypothetical protein
MYMHTLLYTHSYPHGKNSSLGKTYPIDHSQGDVRVYEVIIMETQLSLPGNIKTTKIS